MSTGAWVAVAAVVVALAFGLWRRCRRPVPRGARSRGRDRRVCVVWDRVAGRAGGAGHAAAVLVRVLCPVPHDPGRPGRRRGPGGRGRARRGRRGGAPRRCDSASTSTWAMPSWVAATSSSTRRVARQGWQNALENCNSVARSPSPSSRGAGRQRSVTAPSVSAPVDCRLRRRAEAAVGRGTPEAEGQRERRRRRGRHRSGVHVRSEPATRARPFRSAAGEGRQELDAVARLDHTVAGSAVLTGRSPTSTEHASSTCGRRLAGVCGDDRGEQLGERDGPSTDTRSASTPAAARAEAQ